MGQCLSFQIGSLVPWFYPRSVSLIDIPEDVLGYLISYLTVREIPHICLVSKRFRELVRKHLNITILDPNRGFISHITATYPKIKIEYTKTRCLSSGCSKDDWRFSMIGELPCESCHSNRRRAYYDNKCICELEFEGINMNFILIDGIALGLDSSEYGFIRNKKGYMVCCGKISRNPEGVLVLMEPGNSLKEKYGFNYERYGFGGIKYKKCQYWRIINRKPLIAMKCNRTLTGWDALEGSSNCNSHEPASSQITDKELENSIKVICFVPPSYTVIDHAELGGKIINIDQYTGKVYSKALTPIQCSKYEIEYDHSS